MKNESTNFSGATVDSLSMQLQDAKALLEIYQESEQIDSLSTMDPMPMPFETDIFLIGTEIAGTNHIDNINELAESLAIGDRLILLREPDNPYDERAILVLTQKEEKLGYIPRTNNLILSRLMDAGKELFGVTRLKDCVGTYWKIVVKVYMCE